MEARLVTHAGQLNEILALLKRTGLPYQDIKPDNNLFVCYYGADGRLIGSGGLEFYADYALLRSVAVEENERGHANGKRIVNDLMMRAKGCDVREVYLLTETARDFFLKMGFLTIAREDVPVVVKESTEFASVCAASAASLVYRLRS
jgi:amino-acid N-acetyltransferase